MSEERGWRTVEGGRLMPAAVQGLSRAGSDTGRGNEQEHGGCGHTLSPQRKDRQNWNIKPTNGGGAMALKSSVIHLKQPNRTSGVCWERSPTGTVGLQDLGRVALQKHCPAP